MIKNSSKGFAALEVIAVFVVIGLVGVVAWRVYRAPNSQRVVTKDTATTQVAPIKTSKDLTSAETTLNQADLNFDSDIKDLESQLNF